MKVTIEVPDELIKAIVDEVTKQLKRDNLLKEEECNHNSYMITPYIRNGEPREFRRCSDCSQYLGDYPKHCLMSEGNCKAHDCPTHSFGQPRKP